jgi:hypothetical protein
MDSKLQLSMYGDGSDFSLKLNLKSSKLEIIKQDIIISEGNGTGSITDKRFNC